MRRIINSVAPIRICDNGGWTDTWFAGQGRIFNIRNIPIYLSRYGLRIWEWQECQG